MPASLCPHDSAIEQDCEPSEPPSALTFSLVGGLDSLGLIYSLRHKWSKNILLTEIMHHCVESVEFPGPSVINVRFALLFRGSVCCHKCVCLIPPLSWCKKSLLCLSGLIAWSLQDWPGFRVSPHGLLYTWGKWSLTQKRKWVTNWIYGHYSQSSLLPSVISSSSDRISLQKMQRKAATSPTHPIKSQIVIKMSLKLLWFTFMLMALFVALSLSWRLPSPC